MEKGKNLKLILSMFEQLFGLKINFHKSELFCFGQAQADAALYAELFGCGKGQFPISYLGSYSFQEANDCSMETC